MLISCRQMMPNSGLSVMLRMRSELEIGALLSILTLYWRLHFWIFRFALLDL